MRILCYANILVIKAQACVLPRAPGDHSHPRVPAAAVNRAPLTSRLHQPVFTDHMLSQALSTGGSRVVGKRHNFRLQNMYHLDITWPSHTEVLKLKGVCGVTHQLTSDTSKLCRSYSRSR